MSDVWLNIIMVVVFVLIGGVFSGAEIALVSLRESQVRGLAESGGRRGQALQQAAQRPQPLPRRRPGRRHPGRLLLRRVRCQHAVRAAGRLARRAAGVSRAWPAPLALRRWSRSRSATCRWWSAS